ncbi:cation diffusion facilitator family transporter [Kozakia baliensis]|uniref:cation diffusion facilitator family transporter n=1 Tax=Kozakia baliensis TaxID=153496 RepID=UPI000496E49B|nr:cation diffusion facilitator family transporter [Kozakia baliensis]
MKQDEKLRLGWTSLGVSILVLTMKYLAWKFSASSALLSDALETIINVAAALGALWALTIAGRPADENHTYGHDKAEYLSAVTEAVLVVLTAIGIAFVAWRSWWAPPTDLTPWAGVAFNALGGVINLVWGLVLVRQGRSRRSPALVANGRHVISDVWTTVALVIGVSLIPITGYARLDSILSGLVAINVLRVGFQMMRHSIAGLMDEAPDSETLQTIRTVISEHATGALEAHDLRVRTAGSVSFIEFHMVVPGKMTVDDAHAICDHVEHALRRHIGPALIHIHVEPEEKAKQNGVPVLS